MVSLARTRQNCRHVAAPALTKTIVTPNFRVATQNSKALWPKNSEARMRTSLLVGLIVTLGILIGVGSAPASDLFYPDGSRSQVFNLGNGQLAFVFFNDLVPPDIFVHPVDFFGDLVAVSLNGLVGFGFWLSFEGVTQGLQQYGVYSCNSSNRLSCSVSGTRRGTLFL
jgi:hypothetical protein